MPGQFELDQLAAAAAAIQAGDQAAAAQAIDNMLLESPDGAAVAEAALNHIENGN